MRKLFFLFLFLPLLAQAGPVLIDGIYYNIVKKAKYAEVTRNPNYYTGAVDIPETVEFEGVTCDVTSIGELAFYACTSLTSVTIPNSVTSIGWDAFSGCTGLTSVTIPNSVTTIGNYAFRGCTSLTSVTIPNSVTTIDEYTFYDCSSLTSITIPNSVTSIGNSAFEGCTGLTSVTIPNSVTTIGNFAFRFCRGLTSVTIPNSVTTIGNYAFSGCTGLTSVTIPNSVTTIDMYAFNGCSGLTSVTIPNSVTFIDRSAFYDCTGLTSITIPNSVTTIGRDAFSGCAGLTSIIIGSGVKEIGYSAFANCEEVLDVYCYAENVPTTKSNAFENSLIEYVTLHVPSGSLSSYKTRVPWSGFGKFVALGGSEPEQCATPDIHYAEGKLVFSCATAGAEFVSEITDADIKKHYDSTVELTATYDISVYAMATGFENSDVATATLCWIDAEPAQQVDSGTLQIAATPVLITSHDGIIVLEGVADGRKVSVYSADGVCVGSATSTGGTESIATSLQSGAVAIVKIGERAVKTVMR